MKKKILHPRRKRLNQQARLKVAGTWIKSYKGKNIIRGYAKWFGVDKIGAITELKKMEVLIPETLENQIRESITLKAELKARRKKQKELERIVEFESDENFAFIVGYTSGGAPYGLLHSEW